MRSLKIERGGVPNLVSFSRGVAEALTGNSDPSKMNGTLHFDLDPEPESEGDAVEDALVDMQTWTKIDRQDERITAKMEEARLKSIAAARAQRADEARAKPAKPSPPTRRGKMLKPRGGHHEVYWVPDKPEPETDAGDCGGTGVAVIRYEDDQDVEGACPGCGHANCPTNSDPKSKPEGDAVEERLWTEIREVVDDLHHRGFQVKAQALRDAADAVRAQLAEERESTPVKPDGDEVDSDEPFLRDVERWAAEEQKEHSVRSYTLRLGVANMRRRLAKERAGERVFVVDSDGDIIDEDGLLAGQVDFERLGVSEGPYAFRRVEEPKAKVVRPYSIRLPAGDRAVLCLCGRAHVDGASRCGMCGVEFGEPRDLEANHD